jgi:hypothetical protein
LSSATPFISSFREGVLYLSERKLDVFFVTLNKSEKDYSPSTMYQDYSVNKELFHCSLKVERPSVRGKGSLQIFHLVLDNNSSVVRIVQGYDPNTMGNYSEN